MVTEDIVQTWWCCGRSCDNRELNYAHCGAWLSSHGRGQCTWFALARDGTPRFSSWEVLVRVFSFAVHDHSLMRIHTPLAEKKVSHGDRCQLLVFPGKWRNARMNQKTTTEGLIIVMNVYKGYKKDWLTRSWSVFWHSLEVETWVPLISLFFNQELKVGGSVHVHGECGSCQAGWIKDP